MSIICDTLLDFLFIVPFVPIKQSSEFALVQCPNPKNHVSQIIDTHIEEHSKKPAIVRDKIVELVGDMPRIELFARQTVDGWDCWGNEV